MRSILRRSRRARAASAEAATTRSSASAAEASFAFALPVGWSPGSTPVLPKAARPRRASPDTSATTRAKAAASSSSPASNPVTAPKPPAAARRQWKAPLPVRAAPEPRAASASEAAAAHGAPRPFPAAEGLAASIRRRARWASEGPHGQAPVPGSGEPQAFSSSSRPASKERRRLRSRASSDRARAAFSSRSCRRRPPARCRRPKIATSSSSARTFHTPQVFLRSELLPSSITGSVPLSVASARGDTGLHLFPWI